MCVWGGVISCIDGPAATLPASLNASSIILSAVLGNTVKIVLSNSWSVYFVCFQVFVVFVLLGRACFKVEMKALDELVMHKLPRLHAHLLATDCDISLFATDWWVYGADQYPTSYLNTPLCVTLCVTHLTPLGAGSKARGRRWTG